MRGYVAWMLVALVAVIAFTAITEGPIRDAAWDRDCAILKSGGAVSAEDADLGDFLRHCP